MDLTNNALILLEILDSDLNGGRRPSARGFSGNSRGRRTPLRPGFAGARPHSVGTDGPGPHGQSLAARAAAFRPEIRGRELLGFVAGSLVLLAAVFA